MAEEVKKLSSWKKIGENIQWFFTEIMKIYSTQDSFFSKKRVESGIGFVIAEWGMIFFLMKKFHVKEKEKFFLTYAKIYNIIVKVVVCMVQTQI